MTKRDIVTEIADSTGIQANKVAQVIDRFMKVVKEAVANKDSVQLRGFGTIEYTLTSDRKARNIKANETIVIPAHGKVKFKPAADFKALLHDVK